jgi:hypothetical protein
MRNPRKGDIVRTCTRTSWGGIRCPPGSTQDTGILLRRTYMAYDSSNSKWAVLINGTVEEHTEKTFQLVAGS